MKETLRIQERRQQFYSYLSTFEDSLDQLCKFYLLLNVLESMNSNTSEIKKESCEKMNMLLRKMYELYERFNLGKHLSTSLHENMMKTLSKKTYHEAHFKQAQNEIETLLEQTYFPGFLKSPFSQPAQLDVVKNERTSHIPIFVHSGTSQTLSNLVFDLRIEQS